MPWLGKIFYRPAIKKVRIFFHMKGESMMQVGLNNYQIGNSNGAERADKYASVSAYQAYLKKTYSCLSASDYKVTISPVYLEKCIKDPKEAELLEKNLAHVPITKQMAKAFWSAQGARVVNDELIFDENGNCCGSFNTYVTNSKASSDNSVQNETPAKKGQQKKASPQEHYEKRKLQREQFDERLAEKEYLREYLIEQLEEDGRKEELLNKSILSKEQNAGRCIERYEANILTS